MYVWLCWVFVSVGGLSLVVASGGHSSSRCAGLSLTRPLVAEHRLQTRRLSNCGSRAELLRGMWDLPRPGLEPASPALAGRLSTTAPPGKPREHNFFRLLLITNKVKHKNREFSVFRDISTNLDIEVTAFSTKMQFLCGFLYLKFLLRICC